MVTVGIFPFKKKSHGRAGNRTRDLMISSQSLWPLDHEAGYPAYILNNQSGYRLQHFFSLQLKTVARQNIQTASSQDTAHIRTLKNATDNLD